MILRAYASNATMPARAKPAVPGRASRQTELVQRTASCACGSGCPACKETPAVLANLAVSGPQDPLEREADQIAGNVVRHPSGIAVDSVGVTNTRPHPIGAAPVTPPELHSILVSPGEPLALELRALFEPQVGFNLSNVRVHTDKTAADSARALNARAYTLGHRIIFGAGRYQLHNEEGQALVAHELAHVVQQAHGRATATIQRDCDDPDFCKPYPTSAAAAAAKSSIRSYYLPLEGLKFGPQSRGLYESYLNRKPGESLAPVEFNDPASDLVSSFAESWDTKNDQDAIIDLIGNRLPRAPRPLRDNTPTVMSIENFLSPPEVDDRPINYSNPLAIAGHIAGGIGSSDAGNDYRKVWGNATLEKVPLIGSTGYVKVETTLHYEVVDAIDFCPGDCGSRAEQAVTVPLSRLEASGEAYDVPYKVTFIPESRSKRFFYS